MDHHLKLSVTCSLFLYLFLLELHDEGRVGLSKGAVAGISTGSFLFGLLLCIPFFCYWKREYRRRRKLFSNRTDTFALEAFENQAYIAAPLKG